MARRVSSVALPWCGDKTTLSRASKACGTRGSSAKTSSPAAPRPPPLDLKLLGIFGPESRRIAVLTDGDGWFQNALEQEVIREQFIVHNIGYESVDFTFVGFPDVEPERIEIGG